MLLLITFLVLVGLDSVYLNFNMQYFQKVVKSIQGEGFYVRPGALLAVYLLASGSLVRYVLQPDKGPQEAAILGGLIYAIFSLTNHTIFRKWGLRPTLMDMIWGPILFATTTIIIQHFYTQHPRARSS